MKTSSRPIRFTRAALMGLVFLTGCAAAPGMPGAFVLVLLLLFFSACGQFKDTDRMDEFFLRNWFFSSDDSSSSSSSSSPAEACTGTQDYTQSFDLSAVDLAADGNGFKISGATANDLLGRSVAGVGDFNGDGVGDLIVGASYYSGGTGRAYVIFGRSGTGATDIDLGSFSTADGITIDGSTGTAYLGETDSFSAAGDVNGDGFDDILVGAYKANSYRGRVHLIFGSASPGNVDLSSFTVAEAVRFQGASSADYAGWSVASLGDVNGDDLDDFAIGQRNGSGAQYYGEVNVVFGKTSGWTTPVNTSTVTGTEGFTVVGNTGNYYAGGLTGTGDINGDGVNDLFFGSYRDNSNAGGGYVIYGIAGTRSDINIGGGLSASDGYKITGGATYRMGFAASGNGDFNGDGMNDFAFTSRTYNSNAGRVAVLAGDVGTLTLGALTTSQGFTIDGSSAERAGYSVSMAGDVNGDGLNDLLVGAYVADNSASNSGSAYLIFGQSSIPSSGALLSSYADGTQGIRIDGNVANLRLGTSVDLSDVNGDGCADMIMGGRGSGTSYAFVIYGGK